MMQALDAAVNSGMHLHAGFLLETAAEIEDEFTGDTLQRDFKALERGAGAISVDSQLLAHKQKMGMLGAGSTPAAKALGAGERNEDVVGAEITRPSDDKAR